MITTIVYPVPLESPDARDMFAPFVKRFVKSLWEFDPGCEYHLSVILNQGDEDATEQAKHYFDGLPVSFHRYDGAGMDIGSFQHFAQNVATENTFMVCCVTRVYAWKAGWLKRLADAREMLGPGLYGTCISREGGKLHVCTRAYCTDSDTFKKYPTQINSRDQGTYFEVYDGNFHDFHKKEGLQSCVVYWDGASDVSVFDSAHCWLSENIFRRGDQSNLLVFDKHTDAFRDADEARKKQLAEACFIGRDLSGKQPAA